MRYLQMSLVNDYLNGYTNRLCLPETKIKGDVVKINLDKTVLDSFSRDPNFNPIDLYLEHKPSTLKRSYKYQHALVLK